VNPKLILNILSSINGGLITGAALFNPLVGQDVSLKVISVLGICQIIVSAINSNLSTQAATVKEVAAMPGVERIAVNTQANPTLAAVATDANQPKVGAVSPDARAILQNIAKGA